MFLQIAVFINLHNWQENTCVEVFFNKVADLKPVTSLTKGLRHKYFPLSFAKFSFYLKQHPSVAAFVYLPRIKNLFNLALVTKTKP